MKKLFWKAALHLLRQLSSTDINEQLLGENEFLHPELQVIKAQVSASKKRLRFTDEQRRLLAEKGKAIGKRLYDLASIVRPETVLRWHRELVAKKFDSSQSPRKVGRPPTPQDIEKLILQIATDNPAWGYLRIAGSLKNLGDIKFQKALFPIFSRLTASTRLATASMAECRGLNSSDSTWMLCGPLTSSRLKSGRHSDS